MMVPVAGGGLAKLTQGLTTMSSSQFRTTNPPGANDIDASLAMLKEYMDRLVEEGTTRPIRQANS